jgi:hypothetical protein
MQQSTTPAAVQQCKPLDDKHLEASSRAAGIGITVA